MLGSFVARGYDPTSNSRRGDTGTISSGIDPTISSAVLSSDEASMGNWNNRQDSIHLSYLYIAQHCTAFPYENAPRVTVSEPRCYSLALALFGIHLHFTEIIHEKALITAIENTVEIDKAFARPSEQSGKSHSTRRANWKEQKAKTAIPTLDEASAGQTHPERNL
nr:hypothetical protein Iba_chr07eCG5230 [Ipomoea batatas]